MPHDHYDDDDLLRILTSTKVIAMVGASARSARPSHNVMGFLLRRGYRVIPVNPGLEGQLIHEQRVLAHLADIKEPIDIVDVFRDSAHVPTLINEVLALPDLPKYLWMQIGVIDANAAARAEARGIEVVMNRCPAIEIPRLGIL
jgi:predicted CoA-binding protein